MATEHEYWLGQGEIYALGALDGQELDAFEAHLAGGCALCHAWIKETRESLALMPRGLTRIAPPVALKSRVLDQVVPRQRGRIRERQLERWAWRRWMTGAGWLAAAAVIVIAVANLMSSRSEFARLQAELSALRSESAQKDQLLAFLSAPDVRAIELTGLAAAPQAKAKLFWNPISRRGLLVTFGLPKPDPDKAYELWGIAGSEPIPAGVFSVDDRGQTRFTVQDVAGGADFDKFAVTLEPAGGVPKPSGPMVLLGSV